MNYEVVRQVKMKNEDNVPLLNTPMMSDDQWNELAERQVIKNYIRENGREPERVEDAFKWQRKWAREIIEQ